MLSSRSQSADGPEWVSREVHPGAADSDDAAIAADPGGALHLVWTARSAPRGSRWLLYARSDDQGRRWSEPEILQDPRRFGSASEPQLAIDEGGFLHVAWQSAATREQPGRVWYSTRSLGQPFLPPVQLNQSERGARKARLSAQGSALGTLAVAWLDARDAREGETREELYVGLVLDGGREVWDQRVTFSGDAEEGGCTIDRNAVIHLCWKQRNSGDVCYVQSPDGGRRWHDGSGSPMARVLSSSNGRQPCLALGLHPYREVLWLAWFTDDHEARGSGGRQSLMLNVSPNSGAEWFPIGAVVRRSHGQQLQGMSMRVGPDLMPRLVWTTAAPGAIEQLWFATGEL